MATLATTVTDVVTRTITTSSSTASSTNKANPQGGIFEGRNPTHYDVKSPLTLFIIQAVIVIVFTRVLHWPLSKLRQPRVIAEVITGIILGPSIMGRIPHFTQTIFPTASMPAFTLVANIGLVMFLFLVGLEVDLRFLVSNWRVALSVGAAGMAIPFGLGFAVAWGLYHEFHNDGSTVPISFGVYALFIGVALAITAFPVLCRILTSLKLLGTPVGVIVLSAGVANDVVGWILLALCVTLVNASAGLTALYIFLVAVGYSIFLAYAVRPAFLWILRRSGSLSNGPSQAIVALTIFLVLASAFFTDIIGVHPIFGAFMVGLICPHEGGFAIKLTEKIEDLISVQFLPLYFALSGLSTNLGLLDTGMTWAYVIAVTAVAFFGKLAGGTLASRLNGLFWRESATIGVLMSCKGLVELIVLNIGLQAKILSTRTFTIFVVMALLTTFATTPLTTWLYPPWYQQKLTLYKQGKIDWDGNPLISDDSSESEPCDIVKSNITDRMLVYLRLDGLPALSSIVSLITTGSDYRRDSTTSATQVDQNVTKQDKAGVATETVLLSSEITNIAGKPLRIHGLRMMELTERNSSVMKVSELEEFAERDPVIKAFGTSTVAQQVSRNVAMSGQIAIVPNADYSSTLINRAQQLRSDFILVPWSETGNVSEGSSLVGTKLSRDPLSNPEYAKLTNEIFEGGRKVTNVGVFIDRSIIALRTQSNNAESPIAERSGRQLTRSVTGISLPEVDSAVLFRSSDNRGKHQVRTLYRGSSDDLFAFKTALRMAKNKEIEVFIYTLAKNSNDAASIGSKTTTNDNEDVDIAETCAALPSWIQARVHVQEMSTFDVHELSKALLADKATGSANTTVILGRSADPLLSGSALLQEGSSRSMHIPYDSYSGTDLKKVLGLQAASFLNSAHQIDGAVNLLVVQAKQAIEGHEIGRKFSRVSLNGP